MKRALIAIALALTGCRACAPVDRQFTIANDTNASVAVFVAFGANSVVNAASWSVCGVPADAGALLNCSFPLTPKTALSLPLAKQYLNATVSFNAPVGCGTTKAEININNPAWYDVVDVSLVDGFSNRIKLEIDGTSITPTGPSGNAEVLGVFPLGCDICTARQNPPCGQSPGSTGCKAGTQYDPKPPCQYQGKTMGGGSTVRVGLIP